MPCLGLDILGLWGLQGELAGGHLWTLGFYDEERYSSEFVIQSLVLLPVKFLSLMSITKEAQCKCLGHYEHL
jgi:hypothetical protein